MSDRLYRLLPEHIRVQDHAEGQPLRALLGVIGAQLDAIDADLDSMYRDWFIETCHDDRVPYIGELLGVEGVRSVAGRRPFSLRAYVGRTVALRRRKGTLGVLEELGRTTTGWPCRGVEFFQRTLTTQHLDHVRPHAALADLRNGASLIEPYGPFSQLQHTAEVRSASRQQGRFNLPNIGLFFWRAEPFPVVRSVARAIPGSPDPTLHWFTADPAGRDVALFHAGRSESEVADRLDEADAPGPLVPRTLADALAADDPMATPWWRPGREVVRVWLDDVEVPLADLRIVCPWCRDPPLNRWQDVHPPAGTVAIDPTRGRLVVNAAAAPTTVRVSFTTASPDHLGTGPYPRPEAEDAVAELVATGKPIHWVGVRASSPAPNNFLSTLQAAVNSWRSSGADHGVIVLGDSDTYVENVSIPIDPGQTLVLLSGQWSPGDEEVEAAGLRPHLRGRLTVTGSAPAAGQKGGIVRLDGLLVEGEVRVGPGALDTLQLHGVTVIGDVVVQPPSGNATTTGNPDLCLALSASVANDLSAPQTVSRLQLMRSVTRHVEVSGADASVTACTLLGDVDVHALTATNTIFRTRLEVRDRQRGRLTTCWVAPEQRTPQRVRCQPDLALDAAKPSDHADVLRRMVPSFVSTEPSHPAFVQLTRSTPEGIAAGGTEGGAMGVTHDLHQPRRLANLRRALEQYARVGLDVGTFFVT